MSTAPSQPASRLSPKFPGRFQVAVVMAWMALVAVGFELLGTYGATPGDPGRPSDRWPEANAGLNREPGRFQLVMFAHPRCPCTRASLAELDRIMAKAEGRASARVLFFTPRVGQESWARTDLWRSAAAIPGVRSMADPGGLEAARFGAITSGHLLLYGPDGSLRFSGGITASRGHEGDNNGRASVEALLHGSGADRDRMPVFGCPIAGDRTSTDEGVGS